MHWKGGALLARGVDFCFVALWLPSAFTTTDLMIERRIHLLV
jgi:hypothetical protein